ncbi:hypothetical protein AMATHDRAFT_143611 [Amanita thiersii Skay4041]|uniref:N-acetyltransferase domain-containing protein n=1 Tax=Amanita thiersii Skay4041 TaxID=703135 RepID=A0A2A9NRR5_9AGAR|nr:hypothetical protein AMATHDRAFT_143611 [Amanita thiersii Skay4041]
MQILLPEYLRARAKTQVQESEVDDKGQKIRPLTRSEVICLINKFTNITSPAQAMLIRRMKLHRERRRSNLSEEGPQAVVDTVTPLTALPPKQPVNQLVLEMLYNIETTPFENSFMSRLHGFKSSHIPGALFFDWGTITPWMNLMRDIHDHYSCAHPEREQTTSRFAPITYTSLQTDQLGQVHDLLARTFWSGINVKDSLDYSPERCTVVATYKKLVVGVAILSSPQETYITYLAIKAGWDNTHLARVMLYHLIMMNPNKDITLHVSTNNPAVLLYNRFGFKAEEFVAGFYENYLDYRSRASNNAFRLRLRQQ